MKATQYSFVFPSINHICWGLVFPVETSDEDIEMFEGLLTQYSQYETKIEEIEGEENDEKKEEDNNNNNKNEKIEKLGKKITQYVKKGTVYAQIGIQKGTVIISKGIRKAKDEIKLHIKVREDKVVSEKTKERIQKAKLASKTIVKVSKAVVVGATAACNELTNIIVDSASKSEWGKKISENNDPKVQAAKDIGKASIIGVLLLYEELQNAAIILVSEVADASADIATHKYGDNFGKDAAYQIADIVKDSSHIVKNVTDLGPKNITLNVLGNAAVDIMSDPDEKDLHKNTRQNQAKIDPNVQNIALATLAISSSSQNN